MYKPRRTSEFHEEALEDGGILKKRQTRSQMRATTTPLNKVNVWQPQPRLTQFSPSCPTKRTLNPSASGSGTTPARRQASSVEKMVALHKDKKWVQEQSQAIAEHLDEIMQTNPIQGFSTEFFSRGSSALRQMTMKQFVTIVNFYLQCIFRNRVNVGANHVEDITNALHKLKYPYQVSKSWLMTPTTQHSFGHVIVMLDFLKDIAMPAPGKQQDIMEEFCFMETTEQNSCLQTTSDSMALSTSQFTAVIFTEETNHLLFPSAAECFGLWDIQNWDEYNKLIRKVTDRVIQILSDLSDAQALDAELLTLSKRLEQLDEQLLLHTDDTQADKLKELKSLEMKLQQTLSSIEKDVQEHDDKIEQLKNCSQEHANRMKSHRHEMEKLQHRVEKQRCSVGHFQQLKVQLSDLGNQDKFYKRKMHDLTDHCNNQQVRLARAKKQLQDKVENFNMHAQNISLDSDIYSASKEDDLDLMLPLPPKRVDIALRSKRLQRVAQILKQRKTVHDSRRAQLEQQKADLTVAISQLDMDLKNIHLKIESCEQHISRLMESGNTKNAKSTQHQEQLKDTMCQLSNEIENLRIQCDQSSQLWQSEMTRNDDYLTEAERSQEERLKNQETFIKQYKELLQAAEQKLNAAQFNISTNAVNLANAKLAVNGMKLPPFKIVLQEVLNTKNC